MPTGNCGLCGATAELQDSHLLPKSTYKLLKKAAEVDGQKNTNPVVVSVAVALKTSAQVSDYFLCKECEGQFSAGGEKWMMETSWHPDKSFPLRDALLKAKPAHIGKNDVTIYNAASIANVDVAKLLYFAASVFWRAAAHEFGPILGQKPQKLALGPYADELRDFLLGKAPFPKNAALVVTVSSETDDGANELTLMPYLRNKKSGSMQYAFAIPGVGFQLFVGKSIPKSLAACSVVPQPNVIFVGPFDAVQKNMWKLLSKATPKGDLHPAPA